MSNLNQHFGFHSKPSVRLEIRELFKCDKTPFHKEYKIEQPEFNQFCKNARSDSFNKNRQATFLITKDILS